jgi:quinol-cytochrome oxidoreductase complex cytochrome b subunit
MLVPFLDRSRGRRPLERPFFLVVGLMALLYFLTFTTLILFNIAVIERDPFVVMVVTIMVLFGALAWEMRYRRRVRAAPPPAAASPRPHAAA